MGVCRYCGRDAGLMRSAHSACETEIREALAAYFDGRSDLVALEEVATRMSAKGAAGKDLFVGAWDKAIDRSLEDGVLTFEEEKRAIAAAELFTLGQKELDEHGKYMALVKAGTLRELFEGNIPERLKVSGLSLVLQKGEKVVWAFPDTEYIEQRTQRGFSGVSHGLSIRVMKGVYYRPSVFKGSPVERTTALSHGKGTLVITNKNVSFLGSKSVRIPYKKIVTVQPYKDGIGLQRDAATAKPQSFVTGDGWFTYNLIANLAHLT
jgi:hypothetical protein